MCRRFDPGPHHSEAEKPERNSVQAFCLSGLFASLCPEATEEERRSLLQDNFLKSSLSFGKSASEKRYLFKAPLMSTLLPYFVYILITQKDQLLYIGYSSNLDKRVSDHNNGFTKSTACRRPLQLIFCEGYLYKEDALKREANFKTTAGKKAIRLMLNGTLLKLGYKPLLHRLSFEFDSNES